MDRKADIAEAWCTGTSVGKCNILKCKCSCIRRRRSGGLWIAHRGFDFEDIRHTASTGCGFIEGDDQRSQFDEFHDHLSHVVIKCYDLTLLHVSNIYLESCTADQDDSCDIDQNIGHWVEKCGKLSDKFI